MKMSKLVAYTNIGGRDLFFGVPDLNGAVMEECSTINNDYYYITVITFVKENGALFQIEIRQEK
jgi:hypothetical protein